MANVNNTAFEKRYLTSEQLDSMSSEDINRYCFIDGDKKDWDDDFDNEICDNLEHYQLLKTLSGNPLGYIKAKIDYNMSSWLPEDKKLNPRLLYTLQSILSRNKIQVRNASLTGKPNSHIMDSCTNLTSIINKSFDCEVNVDD